MKLKNLLSEKRATILGKWFDLIVESYPADTSSFLKNQKNRFTNPVGHTILEGIEGLFDELLNGMDSEKALPFLDSIIRIRAIQDFTPSRSINFIFLLKKVIREEIKSDHEFDLRPGNEIEEELLMLESKIDGLALLSFDIYMKCREKIHEISSKDLKNRTLFRIKR